MNLFPEHLNDPQKTLRLGGVWVAGILAGLLARVSFADLFACSAHVGWLSTGPRTE